MGKLTLASAIVLGLALGGTLRAGALSLPMAATYVEEGAGTNVPDCASLWSAGTEPDSPVGSFGGQTEQMLDNIISCLNQATTDRTIVLVCNSRDADAGTSDSRDCFYDLSHSSRGLGNANFRLSAHDGPVRAIVGVSKTGMVRIRRSTDDDSPVFDITGGNWILDNLVIDGQDTRSTIEISGEAADSPAHDVEIANSVIEYSNSECIDLPRTIVDNTTVFSDRGPTSVPCKVTYSLATSCRSSWTRPS